MATSSIVFREDICLPRTNCNMLNFVQSIIYSKATHPDSSWSATKVSYNTAGKLEYLIGYSNGTLQATASTVAMSQLENNPQSTLKVTPT